MVLAPFDLVVLLVGLGLYFVASNANAREVGRMMIFAGLLALCFAQGGHVLRIG